MKKRKIVVNIIVKFITGFEKTSILFYCERKQGVGCPGWPLVMEYFQECVSTATFPQLPGRPTFMENSSVCPLAISAVSYVNCIIKPESKPTNGQRFR
jgi:hypothetical protein